MITVIERMHYGTTVGHPSSILDPPWHLCHAPWHLPHSSWNLTHVPGISLMLLEQLSSFHDHP